MTLSKLLSFLAIIFLLPALACSLPGAAAVATRQEPGKSQAAPSAGQESGGAVTGQAGAADGVREPQGDFTATFTVRFEGASAWAYQQVTRQVGGMREVSLHIDGVDAASNPGDVRVVTDGSTTWMTGPGTDNQCVQFPNNQGMDPTFIYPQSLAPIDELPEMMELVGEEEINGRTAQHYQGSGLAFGAWKDAQVELWQAKDDRALLRFALRVVGTDPFFGAGEGSITANYDAAGPAAGAIEPVGGCEISVPVPASPGNFVRLPGLASYETNAGAAEMQLFYQEALAQEGWVESDAPAESEKALVLSYARGQEEVQIQIEPLPTGGCRVKILFLEQ